MKMKKSILVVEDSTSTVFLLKEIINRAGYDVWDHFPSGETALKKIRSAAKGPKKSLPDLIMMDFNLEGEMKGTDTVNKLHEEGFSIPVIYLISSSDNKVREEIKSTGPYAFLTKPPSDEELKMAIELTLQRSDFQKQLKRKIEEQTKDLMTTNEHLSILNSILEISIDQELSTERKLGRSLDHIISLRSIPIIARVSLFSVDSKKKTIELIAQRGMSEDTQKIRRKTPFAQAYCQPALLKGHLCIVKCTDIHRDLPPHLHCCVPIVSNKKIIGILDLYIKERHKTTQKDADFLTSLARPLAKIIKEQTGES